MLSGENIKQIESPCPNRKWWHDFMPPGVSWNFWNPRNSRISAVREIRKNGKCVLVFQVGATCHQCSSTMTDDRRLLQWLGTDDGIWWPLPGIHTVVRPYPSIGGCSSLTLSLLIRIPCSLSGYNLGRQHSQHASRMHVASRWALVAYDML